MNISIIIPVYKVDNKITNNLKRLAEDVARCQDIEIVVVNDGGEQVILESGNFRVINLKENVGAGPARNVGIFNSIGEYIYFFDSDDSFIGFDVLRDLYNIATKNCADICGGNMQFFGEDNSMIPNELLDKEYIFIKEGWIYYDEYQYDYGFMRFIYRTEFIKDNNFLFPNYRRYQDPPFMLKVFSKAVFFYACSFITYKMNIHEKKNWSIEELTGLENGLRDNINFSLEKKYIHSYRNNVRRIFADFGKYWIKFGHGDNRLINDMIKNNILQRIIFPDFSNLKERKLYYNIIGSGEYSEGKELRFGRGISVDFNTYFNTFSCCKWKKYTNVTSVSLVLRIKGRAQVEIYHNRILYGQVSSSLLNVVNVNAENEQYVHIEYQDVNDTGNFSFLIRAQSDVTLYDGFYISNFPLERKNTSIAIIFTTYRREAYIKQNLKRLNRLSDSRIHTFVVDNDASIEIHETNDVTIIPNRNLGGAGGFARGMLEVIDSREKYTHCILMDDDVSIDERILLRLIDFISCIKEDYASAMIGGAMFRNDLTYFLVESGANVDGTLINGFGYGRDMREPYDCLYVDQLRSLDYNAWWFNVIPIEYIKDDNLPLPIFFQWDDVDYGIRNKAQLILLNGICTWHEPFDSKVSAMGAYYKTRNPLIVSSCHIANDRNIVVKRLKNDFQTLIYLYRYDLAEAMILAIEDYLRGPRWLSNVDPCENNDKVKALNIPLVKIEDINYDWYRLCCGIYDCDLLHKIVRVISRNGRYIKKKNDYILPFYANRREQGYRAKSILYYDETNSKGIYMNYDKAKTKNLEKRFKNVIRKFIKDYKGVAHEYRESYKYLITREQWSRFL